MSGHVFIVHGDITKLGSDAWLLPGGHHATPGQTWWHAVSMRPDEIVPADFGYGRRVIRWRPLEVGDPTPYLTDLGGSRGTPVRWYLDAVEEFFAQVHADWDLLERTPRHGRARPLIALPLVGTGQGGQRRKAGEVARELLPLLYEAADRYAFDIALVMIDGAAYSAVQAERATRFQQRAFSMSEALTETARRLSRRAAHGELVLFLGAGVSAAAGLPLWSGLLLELAQELGMETAERDALRALSLLDQARVIESRISGETLGELVSRHLRERSTHYSLAHGLLAALPVDEVVTMNYDTLFEEASLAASRPLAVLPYQPSNQGQRWLLKMHGCVAHPEEIVLTRDHYLEYRSQREALAGIVQALLITRHMLFVGFSLNDENFHQIIRAVRKAMRGGTRRFGTSLVVAGNPLAENLWRGDLRLVPMETEDLPRAARRLEIFLDCVAAGSVAATSHLFDPRYKHLLGADERRIRDALQRLVEEADDGIRSTGAWTEVEAMLRRLGWRQR